MTPTRPRPGEPPDKLPRMDFPEEDPRSQIKALAHLRFMYDGGLLYRKIRAAHQRAVEGELTREEWAEFLTLEPKPRTRKELTRDGVEGSR